MPQSSDIAIYADTSFLVAIYLPEADSEKALRCMQRLSEPLPFTPFHRHELRTGIRLRVFRKEISVEERKSAFSEIENDLEGAILAHRPIPWTDVFRVADEIAEQHAETFGVRSLDLLHVAMARTFGASHFLTFDERQSGLAESAGFKVKF